MAIVLMGKSFGMETQKKALSLDNESSSNDGGKKEKKNKNLENEYSSNDIVKTEKKKKNKKMTIDLETLLTVVEICCNLSNNDRA